MILPRTSLDSSVVKRHELSELQELVLTDSRAEEQSAEAWRQHTSSSNGRNTIEPIPPSIGRHSLPTLDSISGKAEADITEWFAADLPSAALLVS